VGTAGFLDAQRFRALIRLMRDAGLRISDALNLSTDRITDDKLFLYTQKTGTAVYTVLPPFVVKELTASPRVTDKLHFWSGNGELETAVKDWQAKIGTLFDLSGVDNEENFMVSPSVARYLRGRVSSSGCASRARFHLARVHHHKSDGKTLPAMDPKASAAA
jgi:integrase